MKGHKAHHHGVKVAGVHNKHPRAEHKKGGAVESPHEGKWDKDAAPSDAYTGAKSNVLKEAKQRKHGGKAKHHVGKAEGKMAAHRGDRKPRKTGGRASDQSPLSSAHKGSEPKGHKSYEAEAH